MAITKIKPIKKTLKKSLEYIQQEDKTDGKMLVSSFGCSPETADIEFGFTLSQAMEKGNNLAHHLIQSFSPGEIEADTAHEIRRRLADTVTKGRHEYVLATHIDKGHVHNHIIFAQLIWCIIISTYQINEAMLMCDVPVTSSVKNMVYPW